MTAGRGLTSLLCLAAYLAGPAGPAAAGDREPTPADSVSALGWLESGGKNDRWGILGSATGIVVGVGLALWVKSEADQRYDLYLRTADPELAADLFQSAERYDRAALVGFGLAEVSFVALVYFLTRDQERVLVPVRGEPLVRIRKDGAEVGVRFRP